MQLLSYDSFVKKKNFKTNNYYLVNKNTQKNLLFPSCWCLFLIMLIVFELAPFCCNRIWFRGYRCFFIYFKSFEYAYQFICIFFCLFTIYFTQHLIFYLKYYMVAFKYALTSQPAHRHIYHTFSPYIMSCRTGLNVNAFRCPKKNMNLLVFIIIIHVIKMNH